MKFFIFFQKVWCNVCCYIFYFCWYVVLFCSLERFYIVNYLNNLVIQENDMIIMMIYFMLKMVVVISDVKLVFVVNNIYQWVV